ncbi:hypothetical protein IM700_009215 [Paenibacillus sp. DXFW5]|uniref:Uncharacterized protein n=1 Tax=Paenibacillus rhizolycopersici TaxID=2780073 RepID=A0ABS2H304_9BACL|nr:hypothetical protein [Paenibacillus rhizolycopersici]MBM6995845.1 hypothetical protein [Paenibacillus rhizolycopersici]
MIALTAIVGIDVVTAIIGFEATPAITVIYGAISARSCSLSENSGIFWRYLSQIAGFEVTCPIITPLYTANHPQTLPTRKNKAINYR